MDRKRLLELLKEKKVQDYSYTVVFFFVFSFFVYFAIRPNLITAFSLQKELQDVKLQNKQYEEQILQIVNYQSTIEQYRDKLYLLDEAIPTSPQLAKVITDIKNSADQSGTKLTSLTTEEVTIDKKPKSELTTMHVNMTTSAPFSQVELLLKAIIDQRRIKTIDNLSIDLQDAETGVYSITMEIQGYYL